MEVKNRAILTPQDVCTLLAHETVSLLHADADALDAATQLKEGMMSFASASGLTEETGDLLEWVDQEMESARQYSAKGEDTEHLVEPDTLLAVPDAITQLYAAWLLFQTSVDLPMENRQMLLDTAKMLFEMCGLEDTLMKMETPAKRFLRVETLREELTKVHTALGEMSAAV